MRLLIFFPLLIVALSAEEHCGQYISDIFFCREIVLTADEPLSINNSYVALYLMKVDGSIGLKTLSLMPQLEALTITGSNISSVENGAICSLPKLKGIAITENKQFPTLTQSHFTNCDKINQIVLQNLKLEATALHNFPNLKELFFTGHVARFQKEFLRPLSHLKELYIEESDIKDIESGSLCSSSSLETIQVSSNVYLPQINKETFNNCDTVENFEYRNNPVFDLEEKTFSGFVNLKKARINQVRIVHLTKCHLEGLSNLEDLQLEHCNITTIDRDAFEGLVKLKKLSLQSNYLSEFDTPTFSHLTSLKEVVLYQNSIKTIDNFRHPNLENLNVVENNISKIDPDTVKMNLPKLNIMYGGGNNMPREHRRDLISKFRSLNVAFF